MRAWPVLLLLVACSKSTEPNFAATCAPTAAHTGVTCTVTNRGASPGRACATVTLQPVRGQSRLPLVSRRACTAVLAPGASSTVAPRFDRDVGKLCAGTEPAAWNCNVTVLETSRSLGENVPPER